MDRRKRSSCPTSGTVVFSDEYLLIQIFLFVQVRSLLRFRLVNKQWKSIISGEYFHRLYTIHHRPQTNFILCTRRDTKFYYNSGEKSFEPLELNFLSPKILQSSHGLLLLECSKTKPEPKHYYIYNHMLQRHRKLPLNYSDGTVKSVAGICLVYDPSKSLDYKVVCIWKLETTSEIRFEVYSSSSHSWEPLGDPFPEHFKLKFNDGVYWNDNIYWIRLSRTSYVLDLKSGMFGKAPSAKLPRKRNQTNKGYVMESNGHLHCLAHYWEIYTKLTFIVFEMKEDKSGWFEKYCVELSWERLDFGIKDGDVNVLGIVRGEREEESALFFNVHQKIMCYWFCNGKTEVVLDLSNVCPFEHHNSMMLFGCGDAYQFIETLAPV